MAWLPDSAGDRLGPPENVFLLLNLAVDDLLKLLLNLEQLLSLDPQFLLVLLDRVVLKEVDGVLFEDGEEVPSFVLPRYVLQLRPDARPFLRIGVDFREEGENSKGVLQEVAEGGARGNLLLQLNLLLVYC